MMRSLSGDWQLVTWILAGVIRPVETHAGIVRRRKQVDEVSVSE